MMARPQFTRRLISSENTDFKLHCRYSAITSMPPSRAIEEYVGSATLASSVTNNLPGKL